MAAPKTDWYGSTNQTGMAAPIRLVWQHQSDPFYQQLPLNTGEMNTFVDYS